MKKSINYIKFCLKQINLVPKNYSSNQTGFTLIEMLVVIIMVGVLGAIAIPSWLSLVQTRRLNAAQNQAYRSITEAQSNAKKEKLAWEACFRDDGTKVLWATRSVPSANATTSCSNAPNWQPLSNDAKKIAIDTANTSFDNSQTGYYRRQFEYNGSTNPPLRRITLIVRGETNGIKRCVIVSTILGALRTDKDSGCL
jgi:prepilin-type N-terminal cleavage/methylation domain-containing protein